MPLPVSPPPSGGWPTSSRPTRKASRSAPSPSSRCARARAARRSLRFAAKLGLQGFADLQAVAQTEIVDALRPATTRIRERPPTDVVAQVLAADIDNVRTTLEAIDVDAFRGAVGLLADRRRRVFVLAGEIARGAGIALGTQLDLLREGVVVLGGSPARVARQIAELAPGDVVIAIEHRRYERWLLDALARARQAGAEVLALTDRSLSPIATDRATRLRGRGTRCRTVRQLHGDDGTRARACGRGRRPSPAERDRAARRDRARMERGQRADRRVAQLTEQLRDAVRRQLRFDPSDEVLETQGALDVGRVLPAACDQAERLAQAVRPCPVVGVAAVEGRGASATEDLDLGPALARRRCSRAHRCSWHPRRACTRATTSRAGRRTPARRRSRRARLPADRAGAGRRRAPRPVQPPAVRERAAEKRTGDEAAAPAERLDVVDGGDEVVERRIESVRQHDERSMPAACTASAIVSAPATSSASGFSSSRPFRRARRAPRIRAARRARQRSRRRHRWRATPRRSRTRARRAAPRAPLHASPVRDHTPVTHVCGPAASTGPVTVRAHGPAPMSPTFRGVVIETNCTLLAHERHEAAQPRSHRRHGARARPGDAAGHRHDRRRLGQGAGRRGVELERGDAVQHAARPARQAGQGRGT